MEGWLSVWCQPCTGKPHLSFAGGCRAERVARSGRQVWGRGRQGGAQGQAKVVPTNWCPLIIWDSARGFCHRN